MSLYLTTIILIYNSRVLVLKCKHSWFNFVWNVDVKGSLSLNLGDEPLHSLQYCQGVLYFPSGLFSLRLEKKMCYRQGSRSAPKSISLQGNVEKGVSGWHLLHINLYFHIYLCEIGMTRFLNSDIVSFQS